MGDALLNIGEAAIFSITGNRMKIDQYNSLRDAIAASGEDMPISEVEFHSIWGTRSGARIGRLQRCAPGSSSAQSYIFKQGNREKLMQESESIRRWKSIRPDLVPDVVYKKEERSGATLLIECMRGETLEDLLLTAGWPRIWEALEKLQNTVQEVWMATMKPQPVNGAFMKQCQARPL